MPATTVLTAYKGGKKKNTHERRKVLTN